QEALVRIAGDNGRARFAAFQQSFARIEAKPSQLRIGVTGKTLGGEYGPHLALEEIIFVLVLRPDRPGGCGNKREQKNEALVLHRDSMIRTAGGHSSVKTTCH